MNSNQQLVVALLLAGIVITIGIVEANRPESQSELVAWAAGQSGQSGRRDVLGELAGLLGLGPDGAAPRSEHELKLARQLLQLYEQNPGLGNGDRLDAMLREQYGDWEFALPLDSLLADPETRAAFERMLGAAELTGE